MNELERHQAAMKGMAEARKTRSQEKQLKEAREKWADAMMDGDEAAAAKHASERKSIKEMK
ncbi:MAG: hypothetical protein HPY65_13875 [Syntrophaceae bacterium]|nr:hypothetical protein [Syntrophaceae bacterium]